MKLKFPKFFLDNWFKVSVLVIAAGLIFAYGFGKYVTYQKNKADQQREAEEIKAAELRQFQEQKEKEKNRVFLDACITDAEDKYWSYVKLNGTENEDGTVTAPTRVWESARETKTQSIDICFKKYPQ